MQPPVVEHLSNFGHPLHTSPRVTTSLLHFSLGFFKPTSVAHRFMPIFFDLLPALKSSNVAQLPLSIVGFGSVTVGFFLCVYCSHRPSCVDSVDTQFSYCIAISSAFIGFRSGLRSFAPQQSHHH
uniref:Uncharacterized protein n=1 Tax=Cucumis melo TaxID=3656 RepID=A0A9I9CM71_CUCME